MNILKFQLKRTNHQQKCLILNVGLYISFGSSTLTDVLKRHVSLMGSVNCSMQSGENKPKQQELSTMDILRPELTWIDGKCYRVNAVQCGDDNTEQQHPQSTNEYIEEGLFKSILFCVNHIMSRLTGTIMSFRNDL